MNFLVGRALPLPAYACLARLSDLILDSFSRDEEQLSRNPEMSQFSPM